MRIQFAPINIPMSRRIQTVAVCHWVFSFLFLAQCCLAVFVLLILTGYWYISAVYAVWLYLDWETPNQGGRRSEWVRNWTIWRYFRDYFPIHLEKTADLDPRSNYLFGFHPHGVLVAGAFGNFCTETTGFRKLFPGLTSYLCTLPFWFKIPFYRDHIMLAGLVSSAKSSASHILSREGGGNVAVIVIGGAEESLDARPGALSLNILNRKGFIKLAIKRGAHLVPVFSFGENELFNQVKNPKGSILRRVQERLQKILGIALPLFHARGVFQYSFGLLPFRKPIYTIVGKPIIVKQNHTPSNEEIEELHKKYVEELDDLFEKHKVQHGVLESDHLLFT
ncbi:2-acylglycerol O-acyltransferase 1 [Callorhinchus milii]|uniref:Acyltransferase n=1 Tax=Callorhinchus milii TaxID=7868 RepID=A0A4W3JXJ9_CALMI|nr:2-acylglycerol O-acyltransferase 1 [Callorhinchus milii]XP_042195095.1 2-acylglycerol O-acyltransferase 1 [Callorhinchus milii]|eukprot:gi/632934787/ref/XP_007886477.1/ PREDICTED: 2-acylglycerol O-acyltransferase 1 [Callorhinchus milii]